MVDPQYTDSAASYDAWWIPIKPNTDAAMLAGMAHHIFANNWQDQKFIDKFCQGMDAGTMPKQFADRQNFKDYILGKYDNTPKTPEWAEKICGVPAADIKKLAEMYARTKPAALKASWAPGRASYGEQYNRMAAALQAMTGNIGILGGSAEGVGKGWHPEAVAYPYDQYANVWYASIKSDRWAHCVLNYPNVKREEIGLWPRADQWDGKIPNIKAIFWHGSDWFNQLTNINKEIRGDQEAGAGRLHGFDHHPLRLVGRRAVSRSPPISSARTWPCPGTRGITTSIGPRLSSRWASRRPISRCSPSWPTASKSSIRTVKDFGKRYNPRAPRDYFQNNDATDEAYLADWWSNKVQKHQGVSMSWADFKKHGVYKFELDRPQVAFEAQIQHGKPFATPSGKIEILSTTLANIKDWTKTQYGYEIPYIPKWIEPFESLNHEKARKYPFHMITPHPRWRTHSIFHNIPWLRETYQQEITISARDAEKRGIKTGDIVEVWNDRGKVVVPAYVTERCMPGVVVLYEGAWMDLAKDGTDRAGNPDFLTLDQPSPAGAFAYNTILVDFKKTSLDHHPGWDTQATSRSVIFRRDK